MKIKAKLHDRRGVFLREITIEGEQLGETPKAIIFEGTSEVYLLTVRDDPEGAQHYTEAHPLVVLK